MSSPRIIFVVAYSTNRVIGKQNTLPWHLPNDLRHYKALTLHHSILMGRKTYESIGRPLPQRQMIVLTRDPHFSSPYARVIHNLDALFPLTEDLYVIGGAEIYRLLLDRAHLIYATEVHTEIEEGDAFFPILPSHWQEIARIRHFKDAQHTADYDFVTYTKANKL